MPSRSDASVETRSPEPAPPAGTLGTFAGVFTPSILTILGIILFLRLGFVVGAGGLGRALVIIAIANLISILTSVSLATIATNLRVKGGGDYYVISRTLGVEYGGALGLVLFLAQSVSIAFYAIGFGEALTAVLGGGGPAWQPQAIAAGAVAVLFWLAWFGADAATRFQFVIMAVLAAGLIGFFAGGLPRFDPGLVRENWTGAGEVPFWVLFAIFFPAVTGFTQGVSMSGDLRDPARSLPRGTFAAVGLSAVVYLAVAVVFAGVLPAQRLAADYGAMREISALAVLVDAGVIAATLSSALASFLGAPRILQSLARDRVFPFLSPFARGHGAAGNPRRGVLLAAAIALATIALGNLNLIAPVVAMFFLVSYGLLNYATWYEARSASPSFRPTFRWFHPHLCLLGTVVCLGAMLAVDYTAAIAAVAVLFGIFHWVKRTARRARWADSDRAHHLQRIRERLHAMAADPAHAREWRPVILAFSGNADRRARTLRFAAWIEGGSGFTTAVRMLEGEGASAREARADAEAKLRRDIREHTIEAFARAVTAEEPDEAFQVLLQAHGIGAIRPNLVLLNWFDHAPRDRDDPGLALYGHYLRQALRHDCHVVILGAGTADLETVDRTPPDARTIDVWFGDARSGELMLLLAYLMTRTPGFSGARLRLLAPPDEEATADETTERLQRMLGRARIEAGVEIVEAWSAETLLALSRLTTVVFLPFALDGDRPVGPFANPLAELVDGLEVAALVRAFAEVDLDPDPESGRPGEIAAAEERADRAEEVARGAEREAKRAVEAAEEAEETLTDRKIAKEVDPEALTTAERLARDAEREAEEKRRRALKRRAKAEDAKKEADEIAGDDVDPSEDGGREKA